MAFTLTLVYPEFEEIVPRIDAGLLYEQHDFIELARRNINEAQFIQKR